MITSVISCGEFEDVFEEPDLPPNIRAAQPPNLSFQHHVLRFVSLDDSACRVKFAKTLLRIHSSLNRSVILFQDVVQVLYGSVPQRRRSVPSFFLYIRDRRVIDGGPIGIDDAGLRMG